MALNLSTLTNASTSATVLAEAQTTADFLDSVPILKNIARGSNKGGDGKQTTALNQPRSLPLIDGKGYLYLSGVSGNNAVIPQSLGMSNAWTIAIEAWVGDPVPLAASYTDYCILGSTSSAISIRMRYTGVFEVALGGFTDGVNAFRSMSASALNLKALNTFNLSWDGTDTLTVVVNGTTVRTGTLSSPGSFVEFILGERTGSNKESLLGYYRNIVVTESGSEIINCDFTATNIRHNDTKFQCATGQTVTINQSGNDPATIIKKSVLRFDGVNDGLSGLFNQTINDGGYMFAAFSVLGNGGETSGRVFSINSTGGDDWDAAGAIVSGMRGVNLSAYSPSSGWITLHSGLTDDANGDILHDIKFIAGAQRSRVNDADESDQTISLSSLSAEVFNIGDAGTSTDTTSNAAIDLEFLALFPATITDDQADSVRNYINTRNTVFDLKDSLGYYFFDPQVFPNASPAAFVSHWNGNIVGSDNTLNSAVTQTVAIDQPTRDGFKIGFTSNTDHLDIPSTTQAGWQVVGTSLGTFAYKVRANAVTELNLLGNLGHASYRQAGDLYGIILLPETATGADIEAARKLLIDRGAADGTTASSLNLYFLDRSDIVEIKSINFTSVTSLNQTFQGVNYLVSFPQLDLNNTTSAFNAWRNCSSLSSFGTTEIPNCTDFSGAWQGTTALTSFPAGAKLGTAAENVNFDQAFRDSGLTELPAGLDLSKGNTFYLTFYNCSSLTTIDPSVLLGTAHGTATVNFTEAFNNSGLTALPAGLDMSQGSTFTSAFQSCGSLTTIGTGVLLGTANATATVGFNHAFRTTALTALPAGLDMSQGNTFQSTFQNCSSLTTIGSGVLFGTANATATVNFNSAFRTSGLTALPAGLDMSQGDTFQSAFNGCTSLTTIGDGVLLGTASTSVNFAYSFKGCTNLVTLPANLNFSTGDDFQSSFQNCSSLATIGTGVKLGTASTSVNFTSAFNGCTALTELPAGLDMSQGSTFFSAFESCTSLATIGSGVLLGTASNSVNLSSVFKNCTNLVTLPANLNLSQGTKFEGAFQNCISLVTFPAGVFDTMGTTQNYCFQYAWWGCSALSGASVDAILDSIDTSGQSAPSTGPDITINYDTGTTAPAYTTLASLKGKGWVVIVNGTTL